MQAPYWGVDSVRQGDSKVDAKTVENTNFWQPNFAKELSADPTFYMWLRSALQPKDFPAFMGRYLRAGASQVLTAHEVGYLRGHHCKIVPVWNWAYEPDGLSWTGDDGREFGRQEAIKAVMALSHVCTEMPHGICVYADIEPGWSQTANTDFILGWWVYLRMCGLRAGLYVSMTTDNPAISENLKAAFGYDSWTRSEKDEFYLWSQTPHASASHVPGFGPDRPGGAPGNVVLWQYALHVGPHNYAVDLDLADQRGFDAMW